MRNWIAPVGAVTSNFVWNLCISVGCCWCVGYWWFMVSVSLTRGSSWLDGVQCLSDTLCWRQMVGMLVGVSPFKGGMSVRGCAHHMNCNSEKYIVTFDCSNLISWASWLLVQLVGWCLFMFMIHHWVHIWFHIHLSFIHHFVSHTSSIITYISFVLFWFRVGVAWDWIITWWFILKSLGDCLVSVELGWGSVCIVCVCLGITSLVLLNGSLSWLGQWEWPIQNDPCGEPWHIFSSSHSFHTDKSMQVTGTRYRVRYREI